MKWVSVTSSNIEAIALTGAILSVWFRGGAIYDYPQVSVETFEELRSAESVGGAFQELIKSNPERYPPTKRG